MKHVSETELSELFNRFSGKEMKDPNRGTRDLDPVEHELRQYADANGIRLRFKLSDKQQMGTMDYRTDRVSVQLLKQPNGKYRIGNTFKVG